MDLARLFELQRKLDAEIEEKHPTEKRDRIEDKFLALYTEIAECANEWRGFKFWSMNQKPRISIETTQGATEQNAVIYFCGNCGESIDKDNPNLFDIWGDIKEFCPECDDGLLVPMRRKNSLLEEYVDGIHFMLSLGLEFNFGYVNFEQELKEYAEVGTRFKEQTITRQFNGIYYMAAQFESDHQEEDFIELVFLYLALGEMLGFTWEQVVQAYKSKNDENHVRQENGY